MIGRIWSWFSSSKGHENDGRVKCTQCKNRVLVDISVRNDGLCGVCYRRKNPKPAHDSTKPSPYHQLLGTPPDQLDDNQKRSQLSGAISWQNIERINELLSGDTSFLSKHAKYSSYTWLGAAVREGCGIAILEKLVAAGCDPNGYLKSPKESRPLEIAVRKDRMDAIQWLLDQGADPNIGRAIVEAINHEKPSELQIGMLTLLVDGGADINQTFPLFGDENDRFSVLDWAVLYDNSPELIEFLKVRGAKHHWGADKIYASKRELKPRRIVQ